MGSRSLTLFVVACALAVSGCGREVPAPEPDPPNVLFISIDDLRDDLGRYGASVPVTPELDALAAEGVRFSNAFAQASMCTPSRTSVLTGLRPDSNGVADLFTHFRDVVPDVVTLPQAFKENGYRTLSVGKVYHKPDPVSWTDEAWLPERGLKYALEENRAPGREVRGPVFERLDVPDTAYRDGLVAERAVEVLAELGDEPFFLAVGFYKPHLPFAAPEAYWSPYSADELIPAESDSYPEGAPPFGRHDAHELRAHRGVPEAGPLGDELTRQLIHGYLACASYVDAQIGKVLDALDEHGHADDTIVVVWSDHGYYLGEHGLWCKMGVFDDVLRSPLVMRVPGVARAGTEVPGIVELVDIYPTLCELAGIPAPAHVEGTSFAPLLATPEAKWKRAAFSQQINETAGLMGYSVRTERWRFTSWRSVANPREEAGFELYDYGAAENAAGEERNVATVPQNARRLDRMRKLLDAGWRGAGPR